LYEIECFHTLGTPHLGWLKVTALNLFHPTASPPFRKVGSFHITTQPLMEGAFFIRLRRRPRILSVDECVSGVGANPEPRYHCFGWFRHWRITLQSLGACAPKRWGA